MRVENLHEQLVNATSSGIWALDPEGMVTFVNPAGARQLGYANPAHLLGREFSSLTLPAAGLEVVRAPLPDGGMMLTCVEKIQENFRELFDQAPIPIAILHGPQHEYGFVNRVYKDYFLVGIDCRGRTVAQILPEAQAQGFVDLLDQVYRTGVPYVGSETYFEVDKRAFYLNFVYQPFRAANGEVEGIIATISDVTDQVLARGALALERYKLQSIFDQAPAALALWRGPELIFEKVNPEFQSIVGDRELLNKPLIEALPEMVGQEFPDLLRQVYESGQPYVGHEMFSLMAKSKQSAPEPHYWDFTYWRINDPDGKPYGVFDHAVDVTDRVLARQKLEASEASLKRNQDQLSQAIEVSKIGFFEWDLAHHLSCSEQMRKDWGLPADCNLEAVFERIDPQDRELVRTEVEKTVTERVDYRCEYRVNRPDGRQLWVEAQGTITGGRFLGTVVDISERRRRQDELELATLTAEQANQTKSFFLANMSHEIRTPLGAILGFTELLKDEDLNAQDRAQFLEIISRNGKALTRIIDDILDLAKVESGKLRTEQVDFSFYELLRDMRELFSESVRTKNLRFELTVAPEVPDRISSDPTRLRQILTNIVGNAVKFTQQGGVFLSVSRREQEILVEVRDTGVGIEPAQRERLFQPFAQADDSTSRKYGGTGLGLALSHRLAAALGGSVELLDSAQGSLFVVRFQAAAAQGAAADVALGPFSGSLQGRRILVADDTADNRLLIHSILSARGAEVDTVEDGQQALSEGLRGGYDIILIDLQMPVMDGVEATRRLRAAGYTRPILALTAHAMVEERERTRAAGCDGHLTKPIHQAELLGTIAEFLR